MIISHNNNNSITSWHNIKSGIFKLCVDRATRPVDSCEND